MESTSTYHVGQRLTYPGLTGTVIAIEERCPIITSKGLVIEPTITVQWDNGDITGERPEDLA